MGARGGDYLLTWTTYGTWLPGDRRGFVSARERAGGVWSIRNAPNTPYDRDDARLRHRAVHRLDSPPVVLADAQAACVRGAILEVCNTHGLHLRIGAVMRTHIHLVIASPTREGAACLQLFKGVASRRLSLVFGKPAARWWTAGGSHRLLTDRQSIDGAVRYVDDHGDALLKLSSPRDCVDGCGGCGGCPG